MHLQESGEMYLETILILSHQSSYVRSVDVSEYMHYSKPSISRAINLLKDNGYIDVAVDGALTLTQSGREVAETIYERHRVLTAALKALGVDPEIAAEDACKIEHDISNESFAAIKQHMARAGIKAEDE